MCKIHCGIDAHYPNLQTILLKIRSPIHTENIHYSYIESLVKCTATLIVGDINIHQYKPHEFAYIIEKLLNKIEQR